MLKLRYMTKISFLCLIVILILCGNLFARVNDLIISGTLIDKSGLPIEKKKIYLFKYADIGRLFLSASVRRVTPFDITDSDGKFKITADNSFIEGSTYFALAQYKSNKTEIITKSGFPIKFNIRDELNVYKKSDLVIDIGIIIFENGIPSHTKEKAPKTEDASIIKDEPLTFNTSAELSKDKKNVFDDNCNGQRVSSTYFRDADGDGYGNSNDKTGDCKELLGYVANDTDCDDNDANEHPGQTWYYDGDSDRYSNGTTNTTSCTRPPNYRTASELVSASLDCDDNNASVNPGTAETCSEIIIDDEEIVSEDGIPSHGKALETENASIIKEVPLTIYYESIGEIKARELYLLLISKGMKRKNFSEGLAPGSSKTIYYKKEYIEAAQWLKANVNELNSYQIKEGIGATGLYINLW